MTEITANFSSVLRCMARSWLGSAVLTCAFEILNGIVRFNNDTVKDRNFHE